MLRTGFLVVLLICLAVTAMGAEPFLWVEGEQPTTKANIVDNAGFNTINPFALSGGGWLSSFSEPTMPDTGTADYAVDIPTAGAYHFWLRATGSGLGYRLDGGDWVYITINKGVDAECSAANGGFGWPPRIAWFDQGTLDLTAGKHTLSFQFGGIKAGAARFAALDCFVLTTGAFTPNGKYKPNEQAPAISLDIPQGKGWDIPVASDALDPHAMLDLRFLNEKFAGEHGFIGLSKDGNSFVRSGDGQPIRFWATGESTSETYEQLKHHAQFLAKRGVNIIRLHVQIAPQKEGSPITDVDEPTLDNVFRTVAAMKAAGIYTIISPYWADHVTIRKSWNVLADGGVASGQIYFEPALQNAYKAWMKVLYNRVNPYTNVRLADEPAVAIIQFQNENGLLWWEASEFKGKVMDLFRQQYAKFLIDKYGSLEKTRAAWNYNPPNNDIAFPADWDNGLPGMVHIWDLTRDGMKKKGAWPGFIRCSGDFTEFLCRTMYNFNQDMAHYMHNDLGCKQLISTDNWKGPDGLTQDAEYWADTAGDVVAKNTYTGGFHTGVNDGWQVLNGGYYTNESMIKNPVALPFNFKQPLGHPTMIPETSWVHPDAYQSEGPLMMAAQGDLTGFGIGFWFCATDSEWCTINWTKWSDSTPMLQGQYPAAALIARLGLVKAGAPAVVEQRPLQEVFDRKTPLIFDEIGYDDPNHSAGVTLTGDKVTAVDQLAYLVGPVQVNFGGDPANTKIADLKKYIDRTHKIVHSITGQITTDYGKGLYTVNAPMAQAVSGFLRDAGPQRLNDVTIDCKNTYATVIVVSMDNQPLKSSNKVLVQVGTISRPTGWMSQPATLFPNKKPFDCLKIISNGALPWQVENAELTFTITNPNVSTATLLDINGMPLNTPVQVKRHDGKLTVTVPPNTMYLMLTPAMAG